MPEYLRWKDRIKIESFQKLGDDFVMGKVAIDQDSCSGCGLCVPACMPRSIEMVNKKARMVTDLPLCMDCGDCVAICPENSIKVITFVELKRAFRFLDRGKPEPPRRF